VNTIVNPKQTYRIIVRLINLPRSSWLLNNQIYRAENMSAAVVIRSAGSKFGYGQLRVLSRIGQGLLRSG
jgi:hypothetical protein